MDAIISILIRVIDHVAGPIGIVQFMAHTDLDLDLVYFFIDRNVHIQKTAI